MQRCQALFGSRHIRGPGPVHGNVRRCRRRSPLPSGSGKTSAPQIPHGHQLRLVELNRRCDVICDICRFHRRRHPSCRWKKGAGAVTRISVRCVAGTILRAAASGCDIDLASKSICGDRNQDLPEAGRRVAPPPQLPMSISTAMTMTITPAPLLGPPSKVNVQA